MKIWDEKVYQCDCGQEVILLSIDEPPFDDYVNLAIFNQGIYGRNCLYWKERIRHAWQILRHGTIWVDESILDSNTCYRLGKDLLTRAKIISKRIEGKCDMAKLEDVCPVCGIKNINLLADMCDECAKDCDKDDS